MSAEQLCTELGGKKLDSVQRGFVLEIANQIIINSRIATKKLSLFNLALAILLFGVITPLGLLLFHWMADEKL